RLAVLALRPLTGGGRPLQSWYIYRSVTLSSSRQALLHYTLAARGEDAEPQLRASNEGLLRPRVARATDVGVLIPPLLISWLQAAASSSRCACRSRSKRGGNGFCVRSSA